MSVRCRAPPFDRRRARSCPVGFTCPDKVEDSLRWAAHWRRHGRWSAETMVAQKRRFVGGLEQSAAAREWVSELLEGEGVTTEDADAFRLAITEAATNILRHAYEGRFPAAFDLQLEIDEQSVTVHFRDEGKPFHPGNVQAPDP